MKGNQTNKQTSTALNLYSKDPERRMLSMEKGRRLEIYLEPPLAPVCKPSSRNSTQQQVSKMANLWLLFLESA